LCPIIKAKLSQKIPLVKVEKKLPEGINGKTLVITNIIPES
tara:strand:+ start:467 stop:589 length:123 start_codon:yes stop_codon:yes gene_type:complete